MQLHQCDVLGYFTRLNTSAGASWSCGILCGLFASLNLRLLGISLLIRVIGFAFLHARSPSGSWCSFDALGSRCWTPIRLWVDLVVDYLVCLFEMLHIGMRCEVDRMAGQDQYAKQERVRRLGDPHHRLVDGSARRRTLRDLVHSYGIGLDVFSYDIVHEATRGVCLYGSSSGVGSRDLVPGIEQGRPARISNQSYTHACRKFHSHNLGCWRGR